MDTDAPKPDTAEATAKQEVALQSPCYDCGKPSNGIRYMHCQVSGLFVRLCDDCLEDGNLQETIYAEPCWRCGGYGGGREGLDCEECDGSGRAD